LNPEKAPCATIVLVGHCGADGFLLRNAVARALPGVVIEMADDQESLRAHLQPDRLLLVNRVLGGDFEVENGLELIRTLRNREDAPRFMLISNYPAAQAEAVAIGALPGFGKRSVYDESTVRLLREACDAAASTRSPQRPTR